MTSYEFVSSLEQINTSKSKNLGYLTYSDEPPKKSEGGEACFRGHSCCKSWKDGIPMFLVMAPMQELSEEFMRILPFFTKW